MFKKSVYCYKTQRHGDNIRSLQFFWGVKEVNSPTSESQVKSEQGCDGSIHVLYLCRAVDKSVALVDEEEVGNSLHIV